MSSPDTLETFLSGKRIDFGHKRLDQEVFLVIPEKKRIYLSTLQYFVLNNVSVCLRDRGLNHVEAEPSEIVALASKMIDNMTLNAIIVRGLIGVLSHLRKDHQKTAAVMCEHDIIYLYKINLPFPTTKLDHDELLIGNFEPLILESIVNSVKRPIQDLPERYDQYQSPLLQLPQLPGPVTQVLPFCVVSPLQRNLLKRSEQIVRFGRKKPTTRGCLLLGKALTLGKFSYIPEETHLDLEDQLNELWGYEINPSSILLIQIQLLSFQAPEKVLVVALSEEVVVQEKSLKRGDGFLFKKGEDVKVTSSGRTCQVAILVQ